MIKPGLYVIYNAVPFTNARLSVWVISALKRVFNLQLTVTASSSHVYFNVQESAI